MGSDQLRVVGYCRVSTVEQARDGQSLLVQADKLRDYSRLYGLDLITVLSDPGESGKNLDRPGLREALELLDTGQANGLVVAKLDRLTRSVRDLGTLIERYFGTDRAHQLFSVNDSIDTRTAAGRLLLNILASVAQWEREVIVERTQEVLDRKRAAGERCGGVPYGWMLAPDGISLIEHPIEQRWLHFIRTSAASGKSDRDIARVLTLGGARTKQGRRTWSASSVESIRKREAAWAAQSATRSETSSAIAE